MTLRETCKSNLKLSLLLKRNVPCLSVFVKFDLLRIHVRLINFLASHAMLISFFLALAETDPASDWIRVVFILWFRFAFAPIVERLFCSSDKSIYANIDLLPIDWFCGARSAMVASEGGLMGERKYTTRVSEEKSYKLLRVEKKFMSVRGKFIKCLRVGGCLTRLLWRDFLQLLFSSWHHKFPTSSCMSDFVLDKGGRDVEKNRKIIHNNLKAAVDFCRLSISTRRHWSSLNWTNNGTTFITNVRVSQEGVQGRTCEKW